MDIELVDDIVAYKFEKADINSFVAFFPQSSQHLFVNWKVFWVRVSGFFVLRFGRVFLQPVKFCVSSVIIDSVIGLFRFFGCWSFNFWRMVHDVKFDWKGSVSMDFSMAETQFTRQTATNRQTGHIFQLFVGRWNNVKRKSSARIARIDGRTTVSN